MTGNEFREWRQRMGFTRIKAAEVLGLGRNQPGHYEEDRRAVPRYVALACAAVCMGVPPYGKPSE